MRTSLALPDWLTYDIKDYLSRDQYQRLQERTSAQTQRPEWFLQKRIPPWLESFLRDFRDDPDLKRHQEIVDLWIDNDFIIETDPLWFTELRRKFQSRVAHMFILHFNVNDYVFDARFGYLRLIDYLYHVFPPEPDRAEFLLYNRSLGLTHAYHRFPSSTNGTSPSWQRLQTIVGQPAAEEWRYPGSPVQALQILETHLRRERNHTLVFEYAEKVVPAGIIEQQGSDPQVLQQIEALQRWAMDDQFANNRHLILLLTRNASELSSALLETSSEIHQVELPLPNAKARLKYLSYLYYYYMRPLEPNERGRERRELSFDFTADSIHSENLVMNLRKFADRTAGLNRIAIQDIVLDTFQENSPITQAQIRDHKKRVLRAESGDLLEIIEPRHGLSAVGGVGHIVEYLRADIIEALEDNRRRHTVPSGILFLGPPGTGKSMVALALAKETNINFVKLGNIRNQFVGQSERNLRRAISLIRALEPVIVFMDELDQNEGSRSENQTDSGVNKRIFAQLLEVMSDEQLRGRVIWIGASNRPDLVDDAMKRPGRFDDKIPFLVPDAEGRYEIIWCLLRDKYGVDESLLEQLDLGSLVQDARCEGFTGAEIEIICNRAVRRAIAVNDGTLTHDIIFNVLEGFIPSRDIYQYEYMSLLALREVNDRRFLQSIPDQYVQYFNNDDGTEQLAERILELRTYLRGMALRKPDDKR